MSIVSTNNVVSQRMKEIERIAFLEYNLTSKYVDMIMVGVREKADREYDDIQRYQKIVVDFIKNRERHSSLDSVLNSREEITPEFVEGINKADETIMYQPSFEEDMSFFRESYLF